MITMKSKKVCLFRGRIRNEPLYVEHFNRLFEELWKNGIDSKDRIREIEEEIARIKTRAHGGLAIRLC
jgi:hypothetical protein